MRVVGEHGCPLWSDQLWHRQVLSVLVMRGGCFEVHERPPVSGRAHCDGPPAAVLVSVQQTGAPESVLTLEALEGGLPQVCAAVLQSPEQGASVPPAHGAAESGRAAVAPRRVSDGVVQQQLALSAEGAAGTHGAGEAFDRHIQ